MMKRVVRWDGFVCLHSCCCLDLLLLIGRPAGLPSEQTGNNKALVNTPGQYHWGGELYKQLLSMEKNMFASHVFQPSQDQF